MPTHICKYCDKEFIAPNYKHYYCSKACRKEALGHDQIYDHLSAGTIGAIQELIICADLLKRGYETFRSVSPATSCDILALKDNKVFRIEVTLARIRLNTGTVTYARHDPTKYDILALVFPDGNIEYHPPLP